MRLLQGVFIGLLAVAAAGGCVTEEPTEATPPEESESSAERLAKSERWVEQLTLEGVREENQRERTLYLIKSLLYYVPHSTQAVLANGVTHADPKVRENCAFVLGYAKERDAAEALMKLLDDDVESVRLSAAASLVTGHQEPAGVPPLLRALRHEKLHYRREAVKNLRIYSQQYFAFNPEGPQGERDFAAGKWDEWWKKR